MDEDHQNIKIVNSSCFVIMPAHYLMYIEICVLLQNILKIQPKGCQPKKTYVSCMIHYISFAFILFPPLNSPFILFLGLDHHFSVIVSIWQEFCYMLSCMQGLILPIIDVDNVILLFKGKIVTVCFH